MSAGLGDQLDPATYLPDEDRVAVEPEAYRFAGVLLSAAYPSVDFQHFSRSGLAGSALYIASVAVSGRGRASQKEIASSVGTTRMSIHRHTAQLARLATEEVDLSTYPSISPDVLQCLAQGQSVQRVLQERAGRGIESSSSP